MLRFPLKLDATLQQAPVFETLPVGPDDIEVIRWPLSVPSVNGNITGPDLTPRKMGYIRYVAPAFTPTEQTVPSRPKGFLYGILYLKSGGLVTSPAITTPGMIGVLWQGYIHSGTGQFPPSSWPNVRITPGETLHATLWRGSAPTTTSETVTFNLGISARPGPMSSFWLEPYGPASGPGNLISSDPADPAAGGGYSVDTPANVIRRWNSAQFLLTTAAGGPSRFAGLGIASMLTPGRTGWVSQSNVAQAGGTVLEYTFSRGLGYAHEAAPAGIDAICMGLPETTWDDGTGVTGTEQFLFVNDIQAGDQLSTIAIVWEEWAAPA